jgi:hypothetical protein
MAARRLFGFLTLFFLLGYCRLATAHPMGNFSVNHYSKITLESDRSAFDTSSILRKSPPTRSCSRPESRLPTSILIPRQLSAMYLPEVLNWAAVSRSMWMANRHHFDSSPVESSFPWALVDCRR